MREDFLWVEKYRPKTIKDTILSPELKTLFQTFVDNKNVPNLLLTGSQGIGKTTVAKAMLEELGADYIVIGRPITNAPNISQALQEIHNSIW